MENHATSQLPTILVVDDELVTLKLIALMIEETGVGRPVTCQDSRRAMALIADEAVSLVLLDLHMPYVSGADLLEEISRDYPQIPTIVLTSEDRVETAVFCMKRGAFDFMTKPVDRNRLMAAIRNAFTLSDLRQEVLSARDGARTAPEHPEYFADIRTNSHRMRSIFAYVEAIAQSPRAVLITGESGTGKELFARVIHNVSRRRGSFVPINVSGLDDTMFSDSLFGHLRGSYTGADSVRKGLVDQAKDGTLFLDEIGDLDQGPQIKLLRLLQEGEYYPIGSDTPSVSRARIIAATNADLGFKQEAGTFRKDLYYRLLSHRIELPPLRQRLEDIPLLVNHFIAESAVDLHRPAPTVDPAVYRLLQAHSFPGNIRELQALVYDAFSRCQDPKLVPGHFQVSWERPPELGSLPLEGLSELGPIAEPENTLSDRPRGLRGPADLWLGDELPKMDAANDFLMQTALERSGGNQVKAAALLGISQSTLSRWLANRNKT